MNASLFLIVFLGTFLILTSILWLGNRWRNNSHWLGKNPLKINATVIAIDELRHTTKSFEEQIGYQVRCEWHEFDQEHPQIFLSEVLFKKPQITIGSKVAVYLSTREPGKYFVAID